MPTRILGVPLSADETMLLILAFSCFSQLASIAEDPVAQMPVGIRIDESPLPRKTHT